MNEPDVRPKATSPEIARMDSAAEMLATLCDAINALAGWERHEELVTFARSRLFMAPGLLLDGVPGAIHREAWQALKRDLAADTPARRWDQAGHRRGRDSIKRLLGAENWPAYATVPFRTLDTDHGPRIAAAVGGDRPLTRGRIDVHGFLDITDVLLWEPRSNSIAIADEPDAARLIMPSEDNRADRLTVYRDPFAFLRDWVARRVEVLALYQGGHKHFETRDGCLPGALVIGDLERIPWHKMRVPALVTGPGLDRRALSRAVYRAHQLPPVLEATHGHAR